MKSETTLAAALAKAGLPQHQMRAFTACAEFINAGGTRAEWLQVYDLVDGKIAARGKAAPKPPARERPPTKADLASRAIARERSAQSVFETYLTHAQGLRAGARSRHAADHGAPSRPTLHGKTARP